MSPASASSSPRPAYTYARHYVDGQVSWYSYAEDQNRAEVTAVARLKSYVRRGIGAEQVKWVALNADGQDLSAQARTFPSYDVSLDPRDPDGLALPDTQKAGELQGPADDLLTFYVGLSSRAGIEDLHQPGQSQVAPSLLPGNFSCPTAPAGQDLVQLTAGGGGPLPSRLAPD